MRSPTAVAAGLSGIFLLLMTAMGAVGAPCPGAPGQMMIMYSFTWVGFTIGAIPFGRILRDHLRSSGLRHVISLCVTVSAMLLVAYVLVT
ncbi:hypothetical protein [Streptomyces sp. NPDC029721]|uniref:hypothetical protein n=1 Tax=Streptomyces sp. NPDC029721 TaxID=3157090 RepID=UPI0033E3A97C